MSHIRVPVPHPNGGVEEILVDIHDDVVDEIQRRVMDMYIRHGRLLPGSRVLEVLLGPEEWYSVVSLGQSDKRVVPSVRGELKVFTHRHELHCGPTTTPGIHFRLPTEIVIQEWALTRTAAPVAPAAPPPPPPAVEPDLQTMLDAAMYRVGIPYDPTGYSAWFGEVLPEPARESHSLYPDKPRKWEDE